MILPSGVGIRVGPGTRYRGFHMQIHYSNPDLLKNVVDNSGVKLYTTTNPRRDAMGLLWTGGVTFVGEVLPNTNGTVSGTHCVFETMPGYTEANFFGFVPHEHLLGRRVVTELLRKNESGVYVKIADLGREEHFDFEFQYLRKMSPITVQSGDAISTFCSYDSVNKTSIVRGGEATTNEMCIGFLLGYPQEAFNGKVYCSGPRTLVRGTNANTTTSYLDIHPDLSNTDYKLPLSEFFREGKLTCPDAALRNAIDNDE